MSENENGELKSGSSLGQNETFEARIARIQAVLDGQKAEVQGTLEDAPQLAEVNTSQEISEPLAPDLASENADENAESLGAVALSTASETPRKAVAEASFEPEESATIEKSAEEKSEEQSDEGQTDVSQALTETPQDARATDTQENLAATAVPHAHVADKVDAAQHSKPQTPTRAKKRVFPIVLIVLALLLIISGVFVFMKKGKNGTTAASSSSTSLSSTSSSVSASSSSSSVSITSSSSLEKSTTSASSGASSNASQKSSQASHTASSATAPISARQKMINSVNHAGEVTPLDPHITGYEDVFTWSATLTPTDVVNALAGAGVAVHAAPKWIPAAIVHGQGIVNLYQADGTFVAQVNMATGGITPRAK